MGDEEVMGSASPPPSDHKRKLDELDSEPFEQPPASDEANGNSQSVSDGPGDGDGDVDGDAAFTEDPDAKRPRLEDNSDGSEATENGHQEEPVEEENEDDTEPAADSTKNTELEENQEKSDEPLDAVKKESVTEEPYSNSMELQAAENPEESPKEEEHQEYGAEYQDPTPDVGLQEDVSDWKDQSTTSSDQLTSRRMEVPSNKVGVLIGKGGDTIRTLQHSSGARIQITRDSESNPDSTTRPVELIGSLENINKAERLIKDVIAEAEAGGSPSLVARGFSAHSSGGFGEQVHIQVPNEKVGVIIGKGGETIKNLQTRSGARIQLIPQHLPEGDQSRERTVRVTGDRKQIETAKDLIKEVMEQPSGRSSTPSSNNQQNMRSRGSNNNWGGGPRGGHHHSQSTGYNNSNYHPPQRGGGGGPYSSSSSQNHHPPYSSSSQGYGNYPPQQPKNNNYGWDQRPPANMPEQTGYDYNYGGHMHGPGPAMGPPPPSYNYGQQQPPPSYQQQQQSAPPQGGGYYGQGYGEPRYDHHQQHSYGATQPQPPPSAYPPQNPGYGQDQYGKPLAYNMAPPPQQGPYAQQQQQPYGPPRQQPYPGPMQQGYPQYGAAAAPPPSVNDGYSHPAAVAPGGYGQPVSGYGQQVAAYAPAPAGGYGGYPPPQTQQPGYGEQNSGGGYGYQGAADQGQGYGGAPGMGYGGPPPSVQPPPAAAATAYSQPAPAAAPAPAPAQPVPGYDQQSVPQTGGGYAAPQQQPQAQGGYGQYDTSSQQMYR